MTDDIVTYTHTHSKEKNAAYELRFATPKAIHIFAKLSKKNLINEERLGKKENFPNFPNSEE